MSTLATMRDGWKLALEIRDLLKEIRDLLHRRETIEDQLIRERNNNGVRESAD